MPTKNSFNRWIWMESGGIKVPFRPLISDVAGKSAPSAQSYSINRKKSKNLQGEEQEESVPIQSMNVNTYRHSNQSNPKMSSSNIKSWADASSDSDSDDERIAPSNLPGSDFAAAGFPGRTLADIPPNPPFTAFVGNLNRGMENKDFELAMERMMVDCSVSVTILFGVVLTIVFL
jgi:hypothetical protein